MHLESPGLISKKGSDRYLEERSGRAHNNGHFPISEGHDDKAKAYHFDGAYVNSVYGIPKISYSGSVAKNHWPPKGMQVIDLWVETAEVVFGALAFLLLPFLIRSSPKPVPPKPKALKKPKKSDGAIFDLLDLYVDSGGGKEPIFGFQP